ncbi:hypothetical protein BCR33DRAFT_822100 [Rhizoclosmatium globosum]|uniref:Uncharacterized protein n=2 Tax=Rhizoclosmatium globosum TaxID=329046 RepID=A0A1Y2A7I6_9FUNG|nr:hypothetical protein BCR33DRAFT_822100 [Rhizoclosmatium globosum]|eukprot:ORY18469.1 hypothetical protein BCR33DRAFT_822100 [Rhizoclosmatium globosum]
MPPTIPINHYFGPRNQQNKTKVLFYYSMLIFNYELFNCNNFNIRYWSWNYRGCWHQTCPPIVPR